MASKWIRKRWRGHQSDSWQSAALDIKMNLSSIPMRDSPDAGFRFGAFRYDPAQRLLFRDGELVPLAPKALDLLELLLQRRGEAISKDELIKALWPDCVVEEIGLARNVSILRKALGEDAETYIETIPKRGYRFTGSIEAAPTSIPTGWGLRTWVLATAAAILVGVIIYWQFYRSSRYFPEPPGTATIAVLPLDRLNSQLDPAFGQPFSDTLAAEISKLKRIQVTSPSTVRRYRRVGVPIALMGRLLGLDAVIEGTAERFGPITRISIRLSDAHSGKLIWAESYDVAADDPGTAEMTVARAAAAEIGTRLVPR
jgi:DNA-binding winged helix-turn-helix (wHTH) protein/TolB-like protein